MPRERYIPRDNQWTSYPESDWIAFEEAVESDVGAPIRMTILPSGKIVIDFDDLPSGVSENDVKNAVKNHHPHR